MGLNQHRVKSGPAETPLDIASRHVAQRDMRAQRQTDLIEWMQARGLDTRAAEHFSTSLQHCLALSHARLRSLIEPG